MQRYHRQSSTLGDGGKKSCQKGVAGAPPPLLTRPGQAEYVTPPIETDASVDVVPHSAQVAELVDAQASGACDCKIVEVRVFSWAPKRFTQ